MISGIKQNWQEFKGCYDLIWGEKSLHNTSYEKNLFDRAHAAVIQNGKNCLQLDDVTYKLADSKSKNWTTWEKVKVFGEKVILTFKAMKSSNRDLIQNAHRHVSDKKEIVWGDIRAAGQKAREWQNDLQRQRAALREQLAAARHNASDY